MKTHTTLRVAFRRFYPRFNPESFWIPLIQQASGMRVKMSSISSADVVVSSVFESRAEMWKRRLLSRLPTPNVPGAPQQSDKGFKSLWVTGENLRPPLGGFDLTFSFDNDDFGGTNVYLPLLVAELDWSGHLPVPPDAVMNQRSGLNRITAEQATKSRDLDTSNREGFLCAFIGNDEPVRMRAIQELSSVGPVDVYGSAVGKPVAHKYEIARNYRFMLCFENDLYPGYVTEKALEAYQCGCVPLWRGLDSAALLNNRAVLNMASTQNVDEFVETVATLEADKDAMNLMVNEPLLSHQVSLEAALGALADVIHN